MSNTVNNGIPFVPENTIDPAAGLNEALLTVDALLQLAVVSVGDNTPPGSPANGARYVVGTAPTGAWAAGAGAVAQFLDGAWRFYAARYVLNLADGLMYVRQGAAWGVAAAEWTAETVSQAEAEVGTATTRRAWTAQLVRQAIVAWWNGVSSAWGRGFVASANASAGRTALELVKGTSPGNVLVAGSELVGKHTVECLSFLDQGMAPGVTIYTNILAADGRIPNLIIRGALNGYTEPFEARLSWYFLLGEVFRPNVLITATGGVSGVRFYLRVENGKIVIRIDFGGSFYISRLAFDALRIPGVFDLNPSELQGWSAVASNAVGSGEFEARRARTYHSRNILGPVSQSGGIPDGAIIERGSNANGRFTKYADGTVFMDNSGNAITTNPVATVGEVTSVDSNKLRYGYWY